MKLCFKILSFWFKIFRLYIHAGRIIVALSTCSTISLFWESYFGAHVLVEQLIFQPLLFNVILELKVKEPL